MSTPTMPGPLPVRSFLPRAAAIIAWVCEHQEELEAIEFGQLAMDWSPTTTKVKLTRSDLVRPLPGVADLS